MADNFQQNGSSRRRPPLNGSKTDVRPRNFLKKGSDTFLYFPVGSTGKLLAILQLDSDFGKITDGSRTKREFQGTLPLLTDRGNHLDHLRYVFANDGFDFFSNRIGDFHLGSSRRLHGDIDIVEIGVGKHLYLDYPLVQQDTSSDQTD